MGITAGGFISANCSHTGSGTTGSGSSASGTNPNPSAAHACGTQKTAPVGTPAPMGTPGAMGADKFTAPNFNGEPTVSPSQQPQQQKAHSCHSQGKQQTAAACNDSSGNGCNDSNYSAGTPQGNTAQMKAKRSLSR